MSRRPEGFKSSCNVNTHHANGRIKTAYNVYVYMSMQYAYMSIQYVYAIFNNQCSSINGTTTLRPIVPWEVEFEYWRDCGCPKCVTWTLAMTSYPCRCDLSFFAPARDNIGSNADVSHKLALPFLDHQLDDSALVEVNIEVALPLGVNRPLALYQLHTDVCHIRGYDEMRPDASVGQQQTASGKRGRQVHHTMQGRWRSGHAPTTACRDDLVHL